MGACREFARRPLVVFSLVVPKSAPRRFAITGNVREPRVFRQGVFGLFRSQGSWRRRRCAISDVFPSSRRGREATRRVRRARFSEDGSTSSDRNASSRKLSMMKASLACLTPPRRVTSRMFFSGGGDGGPGSKPFSRSFERVLGHKPSCSVAISSASLLLQFWPIRALYTK